MSDLENQFMYLNPQLDDHPLLRLLARRKTLSEFKEAKIEVRRHRTALGFEPAVMYLHFLTGNGSELDCKAESWDYDLNQSLVERGVAAIDEHNEVVRFALALKTALQKSERRFGDGFFSSVLVEYVNKEPWIIKNATVRDVLRHTTTTQPPSQNGDNYQDCRDMINLTLGSRWKELRKRLEYPADAAERILVGAIAQYLDERFSVTDRRKLGWL